MRSSSGTSGSGPPARSVETQRASPRARPFPVGIAVGFYAALALAAVAWRGLADGVLPLSPPGRSPGGGLDLFLDAAIGLGTGLLLVAASRAWTRRSRAGERLARALADALGPLSPAGVGALALASGVAEEAFFRGALQPRVGWLAASLLFGLAHLAPRRELWTWSLFAVLAGGLFGALFEATGSLVAPALGHVVVNALNLHWLAADAARRVGDAAEPGDATPP